jgi:hypothetical protein
MAPLESDPITASPVAVVSPLVLRLLICLFAAEAAAAAAAGIRNAVVIGWLARDVGLT